MRKTENVYHHDSYIMKCKVGEVGRVMVWVEPIFVQMIRDSFFEEPIFECRCLKGGRLQMNIQEKLLHHLLRKTSLNA